MNWMPAQQDQAMGLDSLYARRGLKGLSSSRSESSRSWTSRARAQGVMMAMPRRWASRLPRVLAILAPGRPVRNGTLGAGKDGCGRGAGQNELGHRSCVGSRSGGWSCAGELCGEGGQNGWRHRLRITTLSLFPADIYPKLKENCLITGDAAVGCRAGKDRMTGSSVFQGVQAGWWPSGSGRRLSV